MAENALTMMNRSKKRAEKSMKIAAARLLSELVPAMPEGPTLVAEGAAEGL